MKKIKVSKKFFVLLMIKQHKLSMQKKELKAQIRKLNFEKLKNVFKEKINFYFFMCGVLSTTEMPTFKYMAKNIELYNFAKYMTFGIAGSFVLYNTGAYLITEDKEQKKELKKELKIINKNIILAQKLDEKITTR